MSQTRTLRHRSDIRQRHLASLSVRYLHHRWLLLLALQRYKSTRFESVFFFFSSYELNVFILLGLIGIEATEEEVAERAAQWDQPVSEYLQLAEQYLGFQQPNSIYTFSDALEGSKRVSSICSLVMQCCGYDNDFAEGMVSGYSCLGRLRRKGLNWSGGGNVNHHMRTRRSLLGSWIFLWRLT